MTKHKAFKKKKAYETINKLTTEGWELRELKKIDKSLKEYSGIIGLIPPFAIHQVLTCRGLRNDYLKHFVLKNPEPIICGPLTSAIAISPIHLLFINYLLLYEQYPRSGRKPNINMEKVEDN